MPKVPAKKSAKKTVKQQVSDENAPGTVGRQGLVFEWPQRQLKDDPARQERNLRADRAEAKMLQMELRIKEAIGMLPLHPVRCLHFLHDVLEAGGVWTDMPPKWHKKLHSK